MKYYQRYLEDNRILGQLGVFRSVDNDSEPEVNDPVLAYKDHYEETHPKDNSKEGFLARITGATKNDIETMLAVVDYYNFLADYHPEERYAFVEKSTTEKIFIDNNYQEYYDKNNYYIIYDKKEASIC